MFSVGSGADGRIAETAEVDRVCEGKVYELAFHTGEYFDREGLAEQARVMPSVVVRLRLPDPDARYPVPVIVSPHGYNETNLPSRRLQGTLCIYIILITLVSKPHLV